MKLISLLFTITVLHFTARAQTFTWAKSMGGHSNAYPSDRGTAIATDRSGNVYTVGNFSGIADFDPGPGTFNLTSVAFGSDMFIQKLDSSGNFIWAKKLQGDSASGAFDIFLDGAGNIYICGFYRYNKDFDPGPDTYFLSSNEADVYIMKLDVNGNFIWAKSMGGPGNEGAFSIKVDNAGGIYITGRFNGTVDFDPGPNTYNLTSAGNFDIFICKMDSAGNLLWAHSIGNIYWDEANAMAVDMVGNVYITGSFSGTVDFDPGSAVANLSSVNMNLFIWKISTAGDFIWVKQVIGEYSNGLSIEVDAVSNVYYVGRFSGSNVDFDPGPAVLNLGSGGHVISKLGVGGNLLWAKALVGPPPETIPFAAGAGLSLDNSNNIYVTSQFSTTVDFDPGPSTFNLTSFGSDDIFILKLNNAGNFIWATSFGGIGEDNGIAIALNNNNQVFITGSFRNTVDFDPGSGIYLLTAVAQEDIFIYMLHQESCEFPSPPGSIMGIASVCSGASQTYSINPVAGAVAYTWSLPNGWTGTSNTTSIIATAGSTSGNISVAAINTCGSSSAALLNVTSNSVPATPVAITGNSSASPGQTSVYSINPIGGATGYNWVLNSGGTIISGQNSTSVSINWLTPGNHVLSVNAVNNCGSSNNQQLNVIVSIVTSLVNPDNQFLLRIVPNPSGGDFFLVAKKVKNKLIKIEATNLLGQLVYTSEQRAMTDDYWFKLKFATMPASVYYIKATIDKKIYLRTVVKSN